MMAQHPILFLPYNTGILFSTLNKNLYFKSPVVTCERMKGCKNMGWHCHCQDTLNARAQAYDINCSKDVGSRAWAPCQVICLGLYFRSYKYVLVLSWQEAFFLVLLPFYSWFIRNMKLNAWPHTQLILKSTQLDSWISLCFAWVFIFGKQTVSRCPFSLSLCLFFTTPSGFS